MKKYLKSLTKSTAVRLHASFRPAMDSVDKGAVDRQEILSSSERVMNRVGVGLYKKTRKLKVVIFPNALWPCSSLGQPGYAMEKILAVSSVYPRQFSPWIKADLIINWQDLTEDLVSVKHYIDKSYGYAFHGAVDCYRGHLNFNCNDISKAKVGGINRQVFGYNLDIDPTKYSGRCVCKSNGNAAHDGRIIDCPIRVREVKTDVVYSVLVDNVKDHYAIDFRVIYINGLVDVFYQKRRPLSSRFSNVNSDVVLRRIKDEFSEDEVFQIESFCKNLGVNYGELDVLRDVNSKRIYIVDFAKTPAGPPNGLPKEKAVEAIEEMGVAFCRNVLGPLCTKM